MPFGDAETEVFNRWLFQQKIVTCCNSLVKPTFVGASTLFFLVVSLYGPCCSLNPIVNLSFPKNIGTAMPSSLLVQDISVCSKTTCQYENAVVVLHEQS